MNKKNLMILFSVVGFLFILGITSEGRSQGMHKRAGASPLLEAIYNKSDSEPLQDLLEPFINPSSTGNDEIELSYCRDDQLGVRILCHPDWGLQEEQDSILMIVSAEPSVAIMITRMEASITFISEVNEQVIHSIGQYQEGFQIETVRINNMDAVQVKAFSDQFSDTRVLDYYFLHNNMLYGLLFSVTPEEKWDEYESFIQKIAQSLELIIPDVSTKGVIKDEI